MKRLELVFVDTNVLAYSVDPLDPVKQERALHVLETHRSQAVISTQVLVEFSNFCSGKLRMDRPSVDLMLNEAAQLKTVPADRGMILEASKLSVEHDLSIFDAMIVAAAKRANCALLLTEDFTEGQAFGETVVANPFS